MRQITRLLAFGAAISLLASCGASASPATAATVNGTEISRAQLEEIVADTEDAVVAAAEEAAGAAEESPDAAEDPAAEAESEFTDEDRTEVLAQHQRDMLSLLIQDAVIGSMTDEAGVEISDDDVEELRQQIVDSVEGEERLEELLLADGLSLAVFDDVLVPQQARIVALREQLAEGESLDTRTVRHILVDDEELAQDTFDELEAGADFAELAEERSTDPGSAAQGGELPPAPRGAYVAEFEQATWESEIGELVGPIESQFGFHILEVISEDSTPAADLEPAQLDQLVNPQLMELVEAAYDDAEIEIDPAFGVWDPMTRSVAEPDQVGDPADGPAPAPETPSGEPAPETEEPQG